MKKKVLIISASAGAGHVRAAQALEETAHTHFGDSIDATHVDMMEYVALPVKTMIKSYDIMVKQMPELWGFLYKKSDDPKAMKRLRKMTKHMNRLNAVKLYEYVKQANPDVIVCTHFLPAQTLFAAPEKYGFSQPICMVMTDYDKHNLLMMSGLNRYFVATKKMREKMIFEGVDGACVEITGIPVSPLFYEDLDKIALRKKHGIHEKHRMVLVLSGGFGLAHIDKVIPSLCASEEPTTIVAVAGKNPDLQKTLQEVVVPKHIDLRVVGWTDIMHEYMAMADTIITKPGGLTTSECIALGKHIIAVQPIPGQEEHNAEYILEHGHGVVAHGPADLAYYLAHQKREQKKRPPMAAKLILESALSL